MNTEQRLNIVRNVIHRQAAERIGALCAEHQIAVTPAETTESLNGAMDASMPGLLRTFRMAFAEGADTGTITDLLIESVRRVAEHAVVRLQQEKPVVIPPAPLYIVAEDRERDSLGRTVVHVTPAESIEDAERIAAWIHGFKAKVNVRWVVTPPVQEPGTAVRYTPEWGGLRHRPLALVSASLEPAPA